MIAKVSRAFDRGIWKACESLTSVVCHHVRKKPELYKNLQAPKVAIKPRICYCFEPGHCRVDASEYAMRPFASLDFTGRYLNEYSGNLVFRR